jgi:hypothetical protein
VDRLTIHAASPETGHAMLAALAGFRAELLQSSEGCQVVVTLGRDDAEITAVLNALEEYVTERSSGPARVELNGRAYVMHPAAEPDIS